MAGDAGAAASTSAVAAGVKVTLLSTAMTNHFGVGEWGFAAVVEVDGHRILFDTGKRSGTALQNAAELRVDLAGITDVVLSHGHDDHVGGLVQLRKALREKNPAAVSRAHVARGIFWPRPFDPANAEEDEGNVLDTKAAYEAEGGTFVEHDGPFQLAPGVWLTGPIPRVTAERSYYPNGKVAAPEGLVADTIPEDQALVVDTEEGLVVVVGCGHAGVVNTARHAHGILGNRPIHALIGGLHTYAWQEKNLHWAADEMKQLGLRYLLGAHCTGINPVATFRDRLGADRAAVAVGAVGSVFELGKGLRPGPLSR